MAPKKSKASKGPSAADTPKGNASSVASTGTSTPVTTTTTGDKNLEQSLNHSFGSGGKPDKKIFDAEQDSIKSEIEELQVKLDAVRNKIGLATKGGSGNDRRTTLRAELDSIQSQQGNNKASRSKLLDQVKALNESVAKKVKDLQAAKGKIAFKSVEEVDAHIARLDKQVESGNLKLAEEKRALQEISTTKRQRKTVEGFAIQQQAVDADREKIDEIRKELDDPEAKALSERYDTIKAELDDIKKESDEAFAGRNKLFQERDALQTSLNALFTKKRESAQAFRDANDHYWSKLREDQERRRERFRAQKAAEDAQKKKEIADRLLDEAKAPAYQSQIEDCQTLIDFFNHLSGKPTASLSSSSIFDKSEIAEVPKLEVRKVDDIPQGAVVRKKKGEEEESYFVGGKNRNKNNKKANSSAPKAKVANGDADTPTPAPTKPGELNIPLATLSALLTLSIPPPTSSEDASRVIEDLKTKKTWYEANQARVTTENIAKAEAEVERLHALGESVGNGHAGNGYARKGHADKRVENGNGNGNAVAEEVPEAPAVVEDAGWSVDAPAW
ncbi:hypothetical protein BDN72DRAFT_786031 [Pluteus cervinus]|uniref:Uncharacterized protein n=1 Tax=Pluteus cervinus TaxID=181527 RepID=A0ACD3BD43_9AGAR|nr:hypothetical protein BDN72DRAFT_786031 [Pluteus cervinus]